MAELTLEVTPALLRMLQQSARLNDISLEEECLRRLEGHARRSRRLEEVMEEMRQLRGQAVGALHSQ